MPSGICGGNKLANNLCCGRIIPEVNFLVAHEYKIGQYRMGGLQKSTPQFFTGSFACRIRHQGKCNELV